MKKLLTPLLLVGFSFTSVANSKLDFFAQELVKNYSVENRQSRSAESPSVLLIVQLNPGYVFDDISMSGVRLDTDLGSGCYILSVRVSDIDALAQSDVIDRIEYGPSLKPCLNLARSITKVDKVQTGSDGLLKAFDGTGVLTGIFDEGFDPNHPMMMDTEGNSRVKVYLQYYLYRRVYTSGPMDPADVPVVDGFSYRWFPISQAGTDYEYATHGTQCLGIMAGSKIKKTAENGSKFGGDYYVEEGDIPFYGTAPNSDVYITCGGNKPADILACFKRIVDYGERHNQPVVLSLSQATYSGAHDGSSLFSRELAKLGEKAIICIGSGNVGDAKMAIEKELTETDKVLKTSVGYVNGSLSSAVQFWADDEAMLEPELGIFDKSSGEMLFTVKLTGSDAVTVSSETPGFSEAFSAGTIEITKGIDTSNNRAYAHFNFTRLACKNASNYFPVMMVGGSAGQTINGYVGVDGYNFVSNGIDGCEEGISCGSYNDLASGENVISVGAYVSRNAWITLNNSDQYIGNPIGSILSYSSYGKASGGRTVPTLVAPGMKISCPLSSYVTSKGSYTSTGNNVTAYVKENGREYFWQTSQGTSLATPFVAGTVALWLQANPNLTYDDVLSIIKKSSVKDNYVTGSAEPMQWGEGKLDALAGIKMAIELANAGVDDVVSGTDRKFVVTKSGNGIYNLFYCGDVAGYKASVYSIGGSMVKTVDVIGNEYDLDTSDLAAGVYVVEVAGNNFREVRKIVVD